MVNLTLPNPLNRPGLGEVGSHEPPLSAEAGLPLAKGMPKFTDHLLAPDPKGQVPAGKAIAPPDSALIRKAAEGQTKPEGPTKDPKASRSKSADLANNVKALPKPAAPHTTGDKDSSALKARPTPAHPSDPDNTGKDLGQPDRHAKAQASRLDQKLNPGPGSREPCQAPSAPPLLVIQPEDLPSGEPGAWDGKARDLSQNEDEPWEKRLSDMLMFMGMPPNSLAQDRPSLALLTEQLPTIEAESIPSNLAPSPKLDQLLASADPEAAVEEIKPLGAWLDAMGWSPDGLIVKDPLAFQDLMNTPVSLKDLMKSFQVDPDRVVNEAKVLQATLPPEATPPDMPRATRTQAAAEPPPMASEKLPLPAPAEAAPGLEAEFLGVLLNAAASRPQAGSAPTLQDQDRMNRVEAKAAPQIRLDPMLASLGGPAASARFEGLPKANLLNPAVFQAMDLRSSETFIFAADAPLDTSPVLSRNDSRDWLENIQALSLQTDSSNSPASDRGPAFGPETMVGQLLVETKLDGGGQNQSSDPSPDDDALEPLPGDQAPTFINGATLKTSTAFELTRQEAPKALPAHAMQKTVFESTSLLVKDGGGAMRIDIGNKELGSIDLAVEVKDNRVDIKIVAASQQAREILAVALPALKASLQNQNLNLSKVEIGLSGGSSWSSSDGGSSGRESTAQSEEIFGIKGASRRSSRSYRQASSTQNLQPEAIRDGGSIKVRV